jgi:hypothetical protein
MTTTLNELSLALRIADPADARALRMLAELDEEPDLDGEVLLALIDGEPVAAMSLDDGRVVADPFVATTNAVALLEVRARQLVGGARRRARRRWRLRFA